MHESDKSLVAAVVGDEVQITENLLDADLLLEAWRDGDKKIDVSSANSGSIGGALEIVQVSDHTPTADEQDSFENALFLQAAQDFNTQFMLVSVHEAPFSESESVP